MKEEDKGFKMVYNKDDDESCGITNFNIAKFSQNLLANLIIFIQGESKVRVHFSAALSRLF